MLKFMRTLNHLLHLALNRYELPHVPEGYDMDEETTSDFFACESRDGLKKLLCKLKEKSMMEKMKHDPKFGTSPMCY